MQNHHAFCDKKFFFSNPEQKFSKTDGYSVALYGHYLSNIIENVEDEDQFNGYLVDSWVSMYSPENAIIINPRDFPGVAISLLLLLLRYICFTSLK